MLPAAPVQFNYLHQGLPKIDPSLSGDAQLAQYHPMLQGLVKALQNGDTMPTGNPRMKGMVPYAKMLANKIATEGGTPYSDAAYGEKRTFYSQLGQAGPSSRGGQVNLSNSSIEHLGELSNSLVALNNKDYLGGYLPGVSHLITGARGEATTEQKSLIEANNNNADRYGKESTKLYANSPGSARERIGAAEKFGSGKLTNSKSAAMLKSERNLILDKIGEQQRDADRILGPGKLDLISPQAKKALAKIDANIERLEKNQTGALPGAAPTAPAQGPTAPTGQWQTLPNGVKIRQM